MLVVHTLRDLRECGAVHSRTDYHRGERDLPHRTREQNEWLEVVRNEIEVTV